MPNLTVVKNLSATYMNEKSFRYNVIAYNVIVSEVQKHCRKGEILRMNMAAQSVWKVKKIREGDYGCEERQPGEKVKVLVTVENEQGEVYTFLEEDDWLYENQIEEGSIWPEEIRQRICTI